MPPNVAVPPLQVSQPTPIFSRPVNPNARYLGTTAEGGTWWEAPIAPTSQPPLSQGTPAPQPIATNIGIVETNLSNIAANTAAIQASAHSIAGHDKRITDNTTAHQTNASNIADHDKRITDNTTAHQTNASSIAGHDNRITDNTTAHQTNASNIAGHDNRITDNTTAHQTNASSIADHDNRITDNTSAHQTNASNIAGHDNRITDNTTAHQTNASSIADHDKRITDNTSAHQTNTSNIAGHDKRITDNTNTIERMDAEDKAFREEIRKSNAQLEKRLTAAETINKPQQDDPKKGGQGGNVGKPIPKPVESPLQNALAGLNAQAKRDAWTQLSGAANANLGRATLKGASQVGNSALSAMRQLGNAPSERLLAGANGAPGQVSLSGHSQIKPNDTRLWVQALNNASTFDQPTETKAFEQNTKGLVMGVDWALDNEWRVGLLGGKSQSEHKASRFEGDLDSWHVGTYALHQSGPVALRLGAIHSDHSGKTKRNVEFGSYKDRLAGNYDATSQQAFAELGYNLGSGSLIAEPFANLGYERYSRKGYTEKGGEAALKASAQTLDNFSTTFGLRTASIRNMDSGMSLAPRLSAGWKHLYGALDDTSTQLNQVTGRTFNTKAIGQDRDSLVVEAGLDLNLSARHSIGVAYNGEMGSSSRSNGVMGQWKMAF
ncbi:autotransporter outer membrane beta-barrel domain-containing protein [Pseudomonas sp. Mn2068]